MERLEAEANFDDASIEQQKRQIKAEKESVSESIIQMEDEVAQKDAMILMHAQREEGMHVARIIGGGRPQFSPTTSPAPAQANCPPMLSATVRGAASC